MVQQNSDGNEQAQSLFLTRQVVGVTFSTRIARLGFLFIHLLICLFIYLFI